MPLIDLHCHTTASDGLVAPAELVRHATTCGVDVVAVTDHDTVAGVAEAERTAEGLDVRIVPGIELSTRHGMREIHVLGYFIDARGTPLLDAIARMAAERRDRAARMVDRLCELGYEVTMDDVLAHTVGDVITRPHVARALVARGHVPNVRAAFTEEFIADGGRAYVARTEMTSVEAIQLIEQAGGVSVIAHAGVSHHEGSVKPMGEDVMSQLQAAGLGGIEVDHPDHPPLVRDRLGKLAAKLGLVATGGSDWHGAPEHTLGGWTTSVQNFERLEALARAGG